MLTGELRRPAEVVGPRLAAAAAIPPGAGVAADADDRGGRGARRARPERVPRERAASGAGGAADSAGDSDGAGASGSLAAGPVSGGWVTSHLIGGPGTGP